MCVRSRVCHCVFQIQQGDCDSPDESEAFDEFENCGGELESKMRDLLVALDQ